MPPKRSSAAAERLSELREALLSRPAGGVRSTEAEVCQVDLDGAWPEGGLRRGSLAEWLREGEGNGAEAVALAVARRLLEDGGTLVVVDAEGTFFPPAATAFGIDASEIVVVRPGGDREALWAFDQALRCPAVSVVWGRMETLPGRSYRRLQLSAEEGGTIGFLSRSIRTLSQPAWCDLAVAVRPAPTGGAPRYRLEIVRSRDGRTGRSTEFDWHDDGTIRRTSDSDGENALRLVSAVDGPAPPRRVASAGDEKRA